MSIARRTALSEAQQRMESNEVVRWRGRRTGYFMAGGGMMAPLAIHQRPEYRLVIS